MAIDRALEAIVWQRAGSRCEYCHMPVAFSELPFQMDHIIAQKHGGPSSSENLALSCFYCNSFKGPNIAGIDPLGNETVRLFHPRRDVWSEHFRWDGPVIVGLTGIGRATVAVLRINEPEALAVRQLLMAGRRWPSGS